MGPSLENRSARGSARRPQFWVRFLFFWNPHAKLSGRRVRGGPIWGSAWRCFWAYDVQAVLGIYGAHSAPGLMALLGHLGLMALLGRMALLALVGLMALPPSIHLDFSPFPILLLSFHRSAHQARGQFSSQCFGKGTSKTCQIPAEEANYFYYL